MEIVDTAVFRVTRDADFTVSDEADDLLQAVEDELRRRRFGEVVRVEVESGMSRDMREQLERALEAEPDDVFEIDGLLDLNDLWEIVKTPGFPELRDPPWTPVTQPRLQANESEQPDVMAAMREGDILVHHPYDSFSTSVERLVEEAVADPEVLAIKQTVYRTSDDSPLVPALIRAAERGKQAVCLVELKARFDERANITWARALEEAGVHVVYGLPSLKTHAKCILIIRREGDGVRNYVHVGTGNYHPTTARLYTDFGLLTCDERIGADVADMFNFLTGFGRPRRYRQVLIAPAHLRDGILAEIDRTIDAHREGKHARIALKMNSLVDRRCIRALYEASQAGVPVDLNIRGICCLRPGVPGVSENIRVRLDRRALPRALADLRLRARRRPHDLHRLRRPDAAQPRHARGAAGAGARRGAARRPARHARALLRRRHQRLGAGPGRHLDPPHAERARAPQRPARADDRPRGARARGRRRRRLERDRAHALPGGERLELLERDVLGGEHAGVAAAAPGDDLEALGAQRAQDRALDGGPGGRVRVLERGARDDGVGDPAAALLVEDGAGGAALDLVRARADGLPAELAERSWGSGRRPRAP